MNIDVDFYELPDGTEPVREYLNSLDIKMRAKMYREIDLLVMNGPELREPHSKYLGDDIFVLRAKQSNDISRVLYFFFTGKKAEWNVTAYSHWGDRGPGCGAERFRRENAFQAPRASGADRFFLTSIMKKRIGIKKCGKSRIDENNVLQDIVEGGEGGGCVFLVAFP